MIGGCSCRNQAEELKQIWTPFPPIPAIKHWKPQVSSSAITLSTSAPKNTDTQIQSKKNNGTYRYGQRNNTSNVTHKDS